MKFKMRSVPKGTEHGWKMRLDGVERPVELVELESPRFGKVAFGLRPEGFIGLAIIEPGGGGAATLPYAYMHPESELLVGLVREKRENMGVEPVWCLIGGFIDPGETHRQAAVRETAEESGLDAMEIRELMGLPTNANRAYFVADAKEEGMRAFGLRLPFEQLVKEGESWKLKDTALLPGYKKAGEVRFFPWHEAVLLTADALARSSIAQLLATLKHQGQTPKL